MLEHAAFFEKLESLHESGDEWKSILAGLFVLRSVDAWLAGELRPDPDTPWTAPIREALSNARTRDPVGPMLRETVERIEQAAHPTIRCVAAPLLAYGNQLRHQGDWVLALDVYSSLFRHAQAADDGELVAISGLAAARIMRILGRSDQVDAIYAVIDAHAARMSDDLWLLRSRIGAAAAILFHRGPRDALHALDPIMPRIEATDDDRLRASSYHLRAMIDMRRGRQASSLQWASRAVAMAPDDSFRHAVYSDIAANLMFAQQHELTRQQLTTLRESSTDAEVVYGATLNLIEIAAVQGDAQAFEAHRHDVDPAMLTPGLHAFYHYAIGLGHRRFGRYRASVQAMQDAIAVARPYRVAEVQRAARRKLHSWGVRP